MIRVVTLFLLGVIACASAQIVPTVTVAMGDRGGKLFGKAPDAATTRHYYIAAEPVLWDYAPLGNDPVCGKPLPPPLRNHQSLAKLRISRFSTGGAPPRLRSLAQPVAIAVTASIQINRCFLTVDSR